MHSQFYFLSPVQVVKVTKDNLEEVAKWCGGQVAQAESRKVKGRMDSYVWVPTPKDSHVSWAFPGMYITKRLVKTINKGDLKETWAVFRRDYFEKNYFETVNAAVDETWELQAKQKGNGTKVIPKPEPRTTNVYVDASNDVSEQIEEVKAAVEKIAQATGVDLKVGESTEEYVKGSWPTPSSAKIRNMPVDRTSDQVVTKTEELFSKAPVEESVAKGAVVTDVAFGEIVIEEDEEYITG